MVFGSKKPEWKKHGWPREQVEAGGFSVEGILQRPRRIRQANQSALKATALEHPEQMKETRVRAALRDRQLLCNAGQAGNGLRLGYPQWQVQGSKWRRGRLIERLWKDDGIRAHFDLAT